VQRVDNRLGIANILLQLFWQRKWWWLSPIIVMVLCLVYLTLFAPWPAPPPVDLYNIFSGAMEN
jgi:hypothetical protein